MFPAIGLLFLVILILIGIIFNLPTLFAACVLLLAPCVVVWMIYYIITYVSHADDDKIEKELREFNENFLEIKKEYINDIDSRELLEVGFDAIIENLGTRYSDKFSRVFPKDIFGDEDPEKSFKVIFKKKGIHYYITGIVVDSEASKQNIKLGDKVIKINNNLVTGMSERAFDKFVYYSDFEKLSIELERKSRHINVEIPLEKRANTTKSVEGSFARYEGKYAGYILLKDFKKGSAFQFKKMLEYQLEQGIEALVIDLQENRGGYSNELISIAENFLKKGDIIYTQLSSVKNKKHVYKALSRETRFELPIVVLINYNTASCSEILACTLRDNLGAYIIGQTSYGKGVGQICRENGDRYNYQITHMKWYTPKNQSINNIGVIPDSFETKKTCSLLEIRERILQGRYSTFSVKESDDEVAEQYKEIDIDNNSKKSLSKRNKHKNITSKKKLRKSKKNKVKSNSK